MKKAEANKLQKLTSLLDTAFDLFTTKGVEQTSIAEISSKAGIAKGTFYLYFRDKYDIRNKLISHQSSILFRDAVSDLENEIKQKNTHFDVEGKIIYIVDHIINSLSANKALLTFISKNLSWGIFKKALTTNVAEDDINFRDVYYEMLEESEYDFDQPEYMLFLIVELVSSTCYSTILYSEPADIETIKPYLLKTICSIIDSHKLT